MNYVAFEHKEKFLVLLSENFVEQIKYLEEKWLFDLFIADYASIWGHCRHLKLRTVDDDKIFSKEPFRKHIEPLGNFFTLTCGDREEYERNVTLMKIAELAVKHFIEA